MKARAAEKRWTVAQAAWLLELGVTEVRNMAKKGEFGDGDSVCWYKGKITISSSAINGYVERHRLLTDGKLNPQAESELQRKIRGRTKTKQQ